MSTQPRQATDSPATIPAVEITDTVIDTIGEYVRREITRAEAAARLHCSERQVTRFMAELDLDRNPGESVISRAAAAARKIRKRTLAEAVVAGKVPMEQAAKAAECSVRTMYRLVSKVREQAARRKR